MSIDGTYPMLAVGCIILIAMVMTGGIASGVEAIAYRPLRNKPRMIALITAVGVSMFLENFPRALPFIGPNPRLIPHALHAKDLQYPRRIRHLDADHHDLARGHHDAGP